MKPIPTRERVAQLLRYNPETGMLQWRQRNRATGTIHRKGYRQVRVDGLLYMEHCLAWLLVYGRWPSSQIDHINSDRADNRICNLREATNAQNRANSKVNVDSISGIKGVSREGSRWRARIRINGRLINLGAFSTTDEASAAYLAAAKEAFGAFARS